MAPDPRAWRERCVTRGCRSLSLRPLPDHAAVCLRISVDVTATDGSTEKAFTDYAIVMCILFLAALNYAG